MREFMIEGKDGKLFTYDDFKQIGEFEEKLGIPVHCNVEGDLFRTVTTYDYDLNGARIGLRYDSLFPRPVLTIRTENKDIESQMLKFLKDNNPQVNITERLKI